MRGSHNSTACDWCGAHISYGPPIFPREPESCGKKECDREINRMRLDAEGPDDPREMGGW